MKAVLMLLFAVFLTSGCATQYEEVTDMGELKLTSPAFTDNSMIPAKFTCQGEDINPQLDISGAPNDARSIVLIMDDPDVPMGTWNHWVLFDIAPETSGIAENSVPSGAVQGRNSWGNSEWGGPCPPSGTHRYVFKLYALDITLGLDHSATKADVESAMNNHVLSQATLTGLYQQS